MALRVALVGGGTLPIPPPGYGAVEKYVWNLAQALPDHGVDPIIVNDVVGERGLDEYRWALRARRILADLDPTPDLVHAHTTGVGGVFAFLGPEYVYTSHSRHWLQEGGGPRARWGRWMDARALRGALEAVALNPDMAQAVQDAAGVTPHVVPTGVDLDAYRPDWAARQERRDAGEPLQVVTLGAVTPVKRTHLAADAVEALETEARLRVVGPLPDEGYAGRLRGRDRVTLEGPVPEDEVREHLARADAYVHPSVTEGLSMAVLEAMASGLPLVASDVCVGQVEPGENGVLVPVDLPDDQRVERIREALARLAADPDLRRRWGERSRELARERYSWDVVAEGTAAVYRAALEDA